MQVIKNIKIKTTTSNSHGLFTYISGAQFSYVTFEVAQMTSSNAEYMGVIAGYAQNSTLSNVIVRGSNGIIIYSDFKNQNHSVGGLVGYAINTQFNSVYSAININVTSSVNNKITSVGGIVGHMLDGTMSFSKSLGSTISASNTSTIASAELNVGGVIGYGENYGSISKSFSESTLDVGEALNANVGGLIGHAVGIGIISECYASNYNIEELDYIRSIDISKILNATQINAGGLIGYVKNGTRITKSLSDNSIVLRSGNMMAIGTDINAGGLIGAVEIDLAFADEYLITNSYARGNVLIDAEADLVINKINLVNAGGFVGYLLVNENPLEQPSNVQNYIKIDKSFASGFVYIAARGTINAGGFAGNISNENISKKANINLSYATGNVTAKNVKLDSEVNLGGFVGSSNRFEISNSYTISSVLFKNPNFASQNIGSFTGKNVIISGFVTSTYTNSYYSSDLSGIKEDNAVGGLITNGITKLVSTDYATLVFEETNGEIINNGYYPTLKLDTAPLSSAPSGYIETYDPDDLSHFTFKVMRFNTESQDTGTKINPIVITTAEEFNLISGQSDKHYIQNADIDVDYSTMNKILELNGTYFANGYNLTISDYSIVRNFKGIFEEIGAYNAGVYGLQISINSNLETTSVVNIGIITGKNNGHIANSYVTPTFDMAGGQFNNYNLIVTNQSSVSSTGTITGINNGNVFRTNSNINILSAFGGGAGIYNGGTLGGVVGTNNAIIEMSSYSGNITSSFNINAKSPKDAINTTLANYKKRILGVSGNLSALNTEYKSFVESSGVDIEEIDSEVTSAETEYKKLVASSDSTDDEYVKVMEKLLAIDVPVYVEKRISGEEPLLYDLTQIDLNALENIFEQDAGSYEEEYKNEIFKWFLDNLDVKLNCDSSVVETIENVNGVYRIKEPTTEKNDIYKSENLCLVFRNTEIDELAYVNVILNQVDKDKWRIV